jgi:hypothetical protein
MRSALSHLVSSILGAVLGGGLVLACQPAPAPVFTFAVEHGECACSFDDDATDWDFGRNVERVQQAVCR